MYARAERLGNCPKADEDETSSARILIDGGDGVGRVTKPGLSQKVGEAAINPVPKAMILKEAREAAGQYGYEGRLKITVSVPQGRRSQNLQSQAWDRGRYFYFGNQRNCGAHE